MCGCMCCLSGGGAGVTLETYHDKEDIDQAESNDDKCQSSWDKLHKATVLEAECSVCPKGFLEEQKVPCSFHFSLIHAF